MPARRASVARLFQRLADEGWIDRGGPGGHQGLQIHLTEAGEMKLRELLAARRSVLADVLAPLDESEAAQLSGLLERLLAARTSGRAALERICRLCERSVCAQCPVGHGLDVLLAEQVNWDRE